MQECTFNLAHDISKSLNAHTYVVLAMHIISTVVHKKMFYGKIHNRKKSLVLYMKKIKQSDFGRRRND